VRVTGAAGAPAERLLQPPSPRDVQAHPTQPIGGGLHACTAARLLDYYCPVPMHGPAAAMGMGAALCTITHCQLAKPTRAFTHDPASKHAPRSRNTHLAWPGNIAAWPAWPAAAMQPASGGEPAAAVLLEVLLDLVDGLAGGRQGAGGIVSEVALAEQLASARTAPRASRGRIAEPAGTRRLAEAALTCSTVT
jgi:hypothetical protein